jgi:putative transposase
MPRQLRIEYPGAIYHVMNRGDWREPIFNDGTDRKRFVATLSRVSKLKIATEQQNEFNLI